MSEKAIILVIGENDVVVLGMTDKWAFTYTLVPRDSEPEPRWDQGRQEETHFSPVPRTDSPGHTVLAGFSAIPVYHAYHALNDDQDSGLFKILIFWFLLLLLLLNRLISFVLYVFAASQYPYMHNLHCGSGAIPKARRFDKISLAVASCIIAARQHALMSTGTKPTS
jgi:hypothetical protein